MSKLNVFAVFGILFLSSVLLGSGMYSSNQVFALENQTGTENEAEIEADIEQENKCKKDTECKNENEINNSLTITTITQAQAEQPETSPCEDCFTSILSEDQITSFLAAFGEATGEGLFETLEQLCNFIDDFDAGTNSDLLDQDLYDAAFGQGVTNENPISQEQYEELIQCLQDVGLDVAIPKA